MYRSPAVAPPTLDELQSLAARHHFNISNDDMVQIKDHMTGVLGLYDRLEELPERGLPTKYPSLPGYRPRLEDNTYNAWARVTNTRGAAGGKLYGKTVAVKDNIAIGGVPMLDGSHFLMGLVSAYHATVVSRILDEGAVIKGKAVCENLCFSASSYTSVPNPVLNPYDKERVSGGSSSGNAVLIAIGDVDLGIGSDTGGSIRVPASWCGIVGLKPTTGLVSYAGVIPMESSLDTVGPMAKTVKDCALLLEVLAGYDGGLDPRQPANLIVQNYTELLTGKIRGVRIALIKEGFEGCEPDVAEIVKNSAVTLGSLGAVIEEISFPPHVGAFAPAVSIILEGAYTGYVDGGLVPLTCKGYKDTLTHDFLFNATKVKADTLSVSKKHSLLLGAYVKSKDWPKPQKMKVGKKKQRVMLLEHKPAKIGFPKEKYGHHFYAKAMNVMHDFVEEYDKLFEKYDVLIMPTTKYRAPKQPKAGSSISGHPAISINAGFSEGLPIGMMVVGKHFDDATVLNVAYAVEQKRDAKEQ